MVLTDRGGVVLFRYGLPSVLVIVEDPHHVYGQFIEGFFAMPSFQD